MNFEMRVMNEHMDDDVDHIREPVLGMEFEEEKTQVCRFAKKGIRFLGHQYRRAPGGRNKRSQCPGSSIVIFWLMLRGKVTVNFL